MVRPLVPRPDAEADLLETEALASRRDLKAAFHEIGLARRALETTRATLYPNLAVKAISRADQNTAFTGRVVNSQTVFTLGWSLFDGGLRYTELKEKHSQLREAKLRHDLLARNIRREVRLARLDLEAAEASLGASREELASPAAAGAPACT
jgi:outer membrane protein TolC